MNKPPFALILIAVSIHAQDRPPLQLTLRRAVELAASPEGSARIQIAEEQARQAEARAKQARAGLLPSVDGSVSYQNMNRNIAAFGFESVAIPIAGGFQFPSVVGPFNVFDARANVTQSVLDLSTIRRYQAARTATGAARLERDSTGIQVGAQVAKAYVTALRAEAEAEAVRANVELAEALLEQARSLKNAGTGTGIEVVRAQVQLANEKQRRLFTENERRRARLQLLRAMNLRVDTSVEFTDRLSYVPVEPKELEAAAAKARESRPDYRAQVERETSARLSSNAVSWERFPSVAAFGDYGSIGGAITNALPTRTYGVSLRVPVFDGGRRQARRAESESQLRQERVRTADLRDQIDLEVQLALDALESAEEEVKVAASGLELAEQELAQARRRVAAGVATSLEVTDAQTRLSRARDNQTTALYHHAQARIDLGQATGNLDRFLQ